MSVVGASTHPKVYSPSPEYPTTEYPSMSTHLPRRNLVLEIPTSPPRGQTENIPLRAVIRYRYRISSEYKQIKAQPLGLCLYVTASNLAAIINWRHQHHNTVLKNSSTNVSLGIFNLINFKLHQQQFHLRAISFTCHLSNNKIPHSYVVHVTNYCTMSSNFCDLV